MYYIHRFLYLIYLLISFMIWCLLGVFALAVLVVITLFESLMVFLLNQKLPIIHFIFEWFLRTGLELCKCTMLIFTWSMYCVEGTCFFMKWIMFFLSILSTCLEIISQFVVRLMIWTVRSFVSPFYHALVAAKCVFMTMKHTVCQNCDQTNKILVMTEPYKNNMICSKEECMVNNYNCELDSSALNVINDDIFCSGGTQDVNSVKHNKYNRRFKKTKKPNRM